MKRIFFILLLLMSVVSTAGAEKICVEFGPAADMLCAVNGDNGPNWFVFTGCEDILTIDSPESGREVVSLSASAAGSYIAILSSSEGHPQLGVFSSDKLDYGEAPEVVKIFNPYPGQVANHRWDGEVLLFESDSTLTADAELSSTNISYRYNPRTGDLKRRP